MTRLLLLFCIFPMLLFAQIDPIAKAIKPNVVAITAHFQSGEKEQGFGFVVGEHKERLYIATAGHLLREDNAEPGKENASNIHLVFCGDDRSHTAQIIKATITPFDFGLLEIEKPRGYIWKADCLGTKPVEKMTVGYIGRDNDCYIPSEKVEGAVNRVTLDRITIDINGIGRGTSGAPLLGPDGLMGMIINAESTRAEALTLERLREEITNYGNYPFRFGLGVGEFNSLISTLDVSTYSMVKIEKGTFEMGCKKARDGDCSSEETPVHQVSLSSFYLGKYEVTYEQFKTFAEDAKYITDAEKKGYTYSFNGATWEKITNVNWRYNAKGQLCTVDDYRYPVIHVSQNDAIAFCKWLSQHTGKSYRLPTEAEWEFAARGGVSSKWFRYAGSNDLQQVAWYVVNSEKTIHRIGELNPNELGLYDLSGNVWELCYDWFDQDYYENGRSENPKGPRIGSKIVIRGGSWSDGVYSCRLAARNNQALDYSANCIGFRLARDF